MQPKGKQRVKLAGWTLVTEEVSAGVYEVRATSERGHVVSIKGTDPDGLLAEAVAAAQKIYQA